MTQSDLLKPLVDAIETVKERIRDHRQELSGHEYRTRMSLIDPILRALGWEVSDPKLVGVEYETTSRGRPDYALNHHEINKGAVVEAKSLGSRLEEREVDQVTTYANRLGAPYAALTDGNRWVAYNMRDVSPLPERKVLDISLSEISPHAAALKLLLFWRPNVESGQPVEAETPIVGLPAPDDPPTPSSVEPLPTDDGWIALSEFSPPAGTRAPTSIRFPDSEIRKLTTWKSMIGVVTQWLFDTGKLTPEKVPLSYGAGGGVINNTPTDSSGKELQGAYQVPSEPIYVNNSGRQDRIVPRACNILRALSVDPSDVYVEPR